MLISIILGLGITQILSGFGRWIKQRAVFRTANETYHRVFAYTSAVFFALYIGLLCARLE